MTRKNLTQLKEEVNSTIPPEAIAVPLSNDKVNASQHHALLGNILDSVSLISATQSPVIPHHPTIKATVGIALAITLDAATPIADETYTYQLVGAPSWLTFNRNTRNLTGTPPQNSEGRYDITYLATGSGAGMNYSDTITVAVAAAPLAPIGIHYRVQNNPAGELTAVGTTRFVLNFPDVAEGPVGSDYYQIWWLRSDNFTPTNITAEGFETAGLGLFRFINFNTAPDILATRSQFGIQVVGPIPATTYILTGTRS